VIEKAVRKRPLDPTLATRENLAYWLSRPPRERLAAVEYLRRQVHGSTARLQRVARVVQRVRG